MRPIKKEQAIGWASLHGTLYQVPKHLDVECPNRSCRRSLANVKPSWKDQSEFAWARVRCTICQTNARFIIMDPPQDAKQDPSYEIFVHPAPQMAPPLEPGVAEISPDFSTIFSEAHEAEQLGLSSVVGVAFRKALEFLIKDFLIKKHPDQRDAIASMHLANCIRDLVTNIPLKTCAERAAWLGNDETHYVRSHPNYDVEDLKALIKLTQFWVSSEHLTQEYENRMSHRGKKA